MSTITHSTNAVSKAEQLAYWNESICDAFTHLKCEQIKNSSPLDGFSGSIECCDIDHFQLSKVKSEASLVRKTKPLIGQDSSEVLLLHFQTLGISKNSQSNQDVFLKPGDFTLCRNTEPYSLEIDNYHEMLVACIPVATFSKYSNAQNIPIGAKFKRSDPFSRVVGDHLQQLWKMRNMNLSAQQVDTLGDTALSLLASLLNANASSEILSERQCAHLAAIKRYIADNLHRSELNVAEIASQSSVSTRYIAKLFQLEDIGCRQFILNERLKLAAKKFSLRSYQNTKIIDIAFALGFNSVEHFNRSFKQRYALTPTEYRNEKLAQW